MGRIDATLPAIGTISIDFREESAAIFQLFGDQEFARLRKVAHLGVVASIFTGVNHSREEYMLLQCAVIQLLGKIHKGHYGLAVSSDVTLNGLNRKVTSGEELLKCWALLGNYGHPKFTYGTERGLMSAASRSDALRRWLTQCKKIKDLRQWCRKTLDSFVDEDMHWLITLRRLEAIRGKTNHHYVRNLVLPLDYLFRRNAPGYAKLFRLRALYRRIRHLCMAALDSYYSAQPVTIRLNSALLGLASLTPAEGGETTFDDFLIRTNSWLAEELYLHPRAVAVLSGYEQKALQRIGANFRLHDTEEKRRQWFSSLIADGVGKPPTGRWQPLFRFQLPGDILADSESPPSFAKSIELATGNLGRIHIVANKNSFNERLYVDTLWRPPATIAERFHACGRMGSWLTAFLKSSGDRQIDEMVELAGNDNDLIKAIDSLRDGAFNEQVQSNRSNIQRLFQGILNLVLKDGLVGTIMNFDATGTDEIPVLFRLGLKGEIVTTTCLKH